MTEQVQQALLEAEIDQHAAATLQQEVDLGVRALNQNDPDMAITFFQSALNKVARDFPFRDHISHNLFLAHKQRIEQLLRDNRKDEAKDLFAKALEIEIVGASADEALRRDFAGSYVNLGLAFFENLEVHAALECYRRAIEIRPSPTFHVNVTNVLNVLKQRPALSDLTDRISPQQLGRHIFIACLPKSASTFIKNALVNLTGYWDLFAVYSPWQMEQNIYLPSIVEYAGQNTVTQQHCAASEANIQIMQAFDIRPVVLVRNIFDAIVSLHDFYKRGAYFHSHFRADFLDLDEETQVDLLIDNIAPWYLQFVASWQLAEKENRLEIHWLSYEEFVRNKIDSIATILEFYGLGAPRANIKRLVASMEAQSGKNRFNVGVEGRGQIKLTTAQKSRIMHLSKYHPTTDFSLVGL